MTDKEIIERLQKENEIMKKIINIIIANMRKDGCIYFGFGTFATLEKLNEELKDEPNCKNCKFYGHELDEKVGTDVCYGCRDFRYFERKEKEHD